MNGIFVHDRGARRGRFSGSDMPTYMYSYMSKHVPHLKVKVILVKQPVV